MAKAVFSSVVLLSFLLGFLSCARYREREYRLKGPVQVFIDRCGVPHIFAEDDEDAFYVFGYIQAHFRLFNMDMARRYATGRLAEIFPDLLTSDIFQRLLGSKAMAELTDKSFEKSGIYRKVKIFIQGVNRYIEDAKAGRRWVNELEARIPPQYKMLGIEPSPFLPRDIIAIAKTRSFDLSGGGLLDLAMAITKIILGEDFEKKFSISGIEEVSIVADFPKTRISPFSSSSSSSSLFSHFRSILPLNSNNFVVSGKITKPGYPILENDPHLGVESPSTFFPFQIKTPQYSIKGLTFPFVPFALVGASDNICWGVTTTLIDTIDIVFTTIKEDGEGRYYVMWGGRWVESEVIEDEVFFKTQDGFKSEKIKFLYVPNIGIVVDHGKLEGFSSLLKYVFNISGPLGDKVINILKRVLVMDEKIDEPESMVILLAWPGYKPTSESGAFYLFGNVQDIFDAMRSIFLFQVGIQNFIFADIKGNIGYFPHGEIPLRPFGVKPYLPSSDIFWNGFLPPDFIPRAINPERGYIVTANNDIVGQVFDDDPMNERFYIGAGYDIGFRAKRITDLIEKTRGYIDRITSAYIVNDIHSIAAERFLDLFFKFVSEKDIDEFPSPDKDIMKFIFNSLKEWDFEMDVNKPQPLYFEMLFQMSMANLIWYNFINGFLTQAIKEILTRAISGTEYENLKDLIIAFIPDLAELFFSLFSDEQLSFRSSYPILSGEKGEICVDVGGNVGNGEEQDSYDERRIFLGEDLCPRNEFLNALSKTASYLLKHSSNCVLSDGQENCLRYMCDGGKVENCKLGDFAAKRFHYIIGFPGSDKFEPRDLVRNSLYFRKSGGSLLVYAADINMVELSQAGDGGTGDGTEGGTSVKAPIFLVPDKDKEFVAFEHGGGGQTMKFICEATPTGTRVWYVIPGGPADDPGSPYFANMIDAWACAHEWLKGVQDGWCSIPDDFASWADTQEERFNLIFSTIEDDLNKLLDGNYHTSPLCRGSEKYIVFR